MELTQSSKIWNLIFCFFISVVCYAQQLDIVDFLQVNANIQIFPDEKKVSGLVEYQFLILQKTDSIFLDAKNMVVSENKNSPTKVSLKVTDDKIWLYYPFHTGKKYTVSFSYDAFPSQAMYFFGEQVWTQGQGKYTSHWLPSIDDVNDKMVFNFSVSAPEGLTVISNGKLQGKSAEKDNTHWNYQMEKPMSSYLAAIAVGKFQKQDKTSSSGIPLQNYFLPEDADKAEPTYRYTKQMFDFLEEEIGVAYPWQNYKQVPVRDFLYAGMENTTLTIFSDAFVVDFTAFIDRNYVNVNAHELAHQWFGNLVTAQSSEHHWLHEGFATYYALLAERDIFGDDYYYWKLFQTAEQLRELSDSGKGEALLNPKASSLTFYQKGAWALHILREMVGDKAFKTAIKNYLNKYAFKSVTTDDFLKEVEKAANVDLTSFKEDWLLQTAFKSSEALQSLIKSTFIREYMELSALTTVSFSQKREFLSKYLDAPVNDYFGQEVVYQLAAVPFEEAASLYRKAFRSQNILTRQAIALSLNPIPEGIRKEYESLLDDASYLTKEVALYNLWFQFPDRRTVYLNKTEGIIGFSDKNLRQLWLTLALLTPDYQEENKPFFLTELSNYTSLDFGFDIRKNAFHLLQGIGQLTDENLVHLINASLHPNWRFAKSSRELLDELLKDENLKQSMVSLKNRLTEEERVWLENRLNNQ